MQSEPWTYRYKPTTLQDCVLLKRVRTEIEAMVAANDLPHLLLAGPPGCGKTTLSRVIEAAMDAQELRFESPSLLLKFISETQINDGLSGNTFCPRRLIIVDEAHRLKPSTQSLLKGAIEKSIDSRWILIANDRSKLHSALHSRTHLLDFNPSSKGEKADLCVQTVSLCQKMLEENGVDLARHEVEQLVEETCPDIRSLIQELQSRVMSQSQNVGQF